MAEKKRQKQVCNSSDPRLFIVKSRHGPLVPSDTIEEKKRHSQQPTMMKAKIAKSLACALHLATVATAAFRLSVNLSSGRRTYSTTVLRLSTHEKQEQRAIALSEYLTKAHEEKLRAIQDVEQRKAGEIQALKDEIEALKFRQQSGALSVTGATGTTSPAVGADDLLSLPKEALVNKVLQYQRFMEKYIVQSQEQKVKALKAAEDAVRKRFEDKLVLSTRPSSPEKGEPTLYDARNSAIAAAASAGKSRWGDMEVQRAAAAVGQSSPLVANTSSSPSVPISVPLEVQAADHGIKAEGSLSLAERVSLGINAGARAVASAQMVPAISSTGPSTSGSDSLSQGHLSLYQQRNARILAAAAAGKTRWGLQEVERVQSLASLPSGASRAATIESPTHSVPPEVVAADHGLRSDGSVGGWTLAERVAQGASARLEKLPTAAVTATLGSLYQIRNIRVLQAAAVGKSRWGSQEVDKVKTFVGSLPSGAAVAAPATLNSVGSDRVNVGAQILGRA